MGYAHHPTESPAMPPLRTILLAYLTDYTNNYLTVDKFAGHNGLTPEHAAGLLALARQIHSTSHPDA